MSACSIFERITMINSSGNQSEFSTGQNNHIQQKTRFVQQVDLPPQMMNGTTCVDRGGGTNVATNGNSAVSNSGGSSVGSVNIMRNASPGQGAMEDSVVPNGNSAMLLERDYYGCYCLKFIVKNGTHITEEKVLEDFGTFGEVVDVRGPGLFSGLRGNHVYVRFIDRSDAEEALRNLSSKYHQLTPASISDVLPDNYGLYTISFYNKTGIPSAEVRREFSKFGEVKNLTGSLDVKGGRVFVSYKEKGSAVAALQAFFFRKDRYPNMKFALPRCEKDYFGCYCLKFYNKSGDVTEEKVLRDFGQFGDVVDVRGPGLFDVTGDDVYVRYKEKSSAEQALIELVGRYDSLCLAPPSDIQADKFGYFTITFVNDKCLSKSDVWYIFSKFGTVACVNGTFDCKKGRVFVSYREKQGALNALETMLITKEYHLQVSKNSTVRKNDYNVAVPPPGIVSSSKDDVDFESIPTSTNVSTSLPPPPPQSGSSQQHVTSNVSTASTLNNVVSVANSNITSSVSNSGQAGKMPMTQQLPPFDNSIVNGSKGPAGGGIPAGSHPGLVNGSGNRINVPSTVDDLHLLQRVHPQRHYSQHTRSRSREIVPPSSAGTPMGAPPPPPPHLKQQPPMGNSNGGPGITNSNSSPSFQHPPPSGSNSLQHGHENSPPPLSRQQQQQQPPQQQPLVIGANMQQQASLGHPPSTGHLNNGEPVTANGVMARGNGLVKFNRNVEKDIFGYYCLSFLNEDGDINEKKVRHDFGKFGEVVSVRGALGKQKGHVFVRFRKKEAAENCLNCLNSFPLSEMSELFGKYLFLSPATPRDIDCDTYNTYSISFLNLNSKSFREIRSEFNRFGEIVRLTSGGGGNTDELVSISYSDKNAAVKALQTHFTNKEFPYLDIAKGSSLLLVNSSDSSDNEDYDSDFPRSSRVAPIGPPPPLNAAPGGPVHRHANHSPNHSNRPPHPDDPFHDPTPILGSNCLTGLGLGGGSDVVDELLKPFQSYFNIYRTGQYHSPLGDTSLGGITNNSVPSINEQQQQGGNSYGLGQNIVSGTNGGHVQHSPEKKYKIKTVKMANNSNGNGMSQQLTPPQQHSPQSSTPSKANSPFVPNNSVTMNSNSPAIKQQLIPTNPAEKPLMKSSNTSSINNGLNTEQPLLQAMKPNVGLKTKDKAEPTPVKAKFEKEGTPSSTTSTSSKLSSSSGTSSCVTVSSADNETPDVSMSTENEEQSCRPSSDAVQTPVVVEKDIFGLFSLNLICKSKDLSERKVKADFDKHLPENISFRIRGQFNIGETVTISFNDQETAETCCKNLALLSKYPTLCPAPTTKIVQDKDGYYSVEFSNSGMSGIREITNEFSKYGEVVKVMSSGAKSNAVKRVTVSYADMQSAFEAVSSYSGKRKNKDFQNVDFSKECILEVKTSSNPDLCKEMDMDKDNTATA